MTKTAIIVLAAGLGTRMKSALPKILHKVAGRTLLAHTLEAAKALEPAVTVIVCGPQMTAVKKEALSIIPSAKMAVQTERRGTANAVAAAKAALEGFSGNIVVLYGDVPLIRPETLRQLSMAVDAAHPMAVLGFKANDPKGYGRLVQGPKGEVLAIREELDATPEERQINFCNSGIIAISSNALWNHLAEIGCANAKGEYYLTDLVQLIAAGTGDVALLVCPESEVAGVNDRLQLSQLEAEFQQRCRTRHMLNGVTLMSPETVFFSADTVVGQDVTIEPHVIFGPGVIVADQAEIRGFSHLEGAVIGAGAKIGPFVRLRPGAEIGDEAHIGNFVEVKKASIGKGAKINHLTYVGDAKVGPATNIGAGTITCNYDGFDKHITDIGANVFVGSNTALVAPVKIGDGASIAAGSVITRDVPADSLAIARPELAIREGWAAKYRSMKKVRKARIV